MLVGLALGLQTSSARDEKEKEAEEGGEGLLTLMDFEGPMYSDKTRQRLKLLTAKGVTITEQVCQKLGIPSPKVSRARVDDGGGSVEERKKRRRRRRRRKRRRKSKKGVKHGVHSRTACVWPSSCGPVKRLTAL